MYKLYFWLFLQLALSSPSVFAQNLDTALIVTPQILSASSSEQNEWVSLSVSIGFIHSTLSVTAPDGTTPGTALQDTLNSSKTLTEKALRSVLNADVSSKQEPSGNPDGIAASITVFPNPFVDHLTLYFDGSAIETGNAPLQYTLLDITGNSLETGPLERGGKEIAMSSIPNGVYFLVLFQNDQEIKSFKLLKNNL